jgi:hypothetical protein
MKLAASFFTQENMSSIFTNPLDTFKTDRLIFDITIRLEDKDINSIADFWKNIGNLGPKFNQYRVLYARLYPTNPDAAALAESEGHPLEKIGGRRRKSRRSKPSKRSHRKSKRRHH